MMRLDSLFDVEYGNKLDMNKMSQVTDGGGISFVGRRGNNQGVSGYVDKLPGVAPYMPGKITVALGGSYLLSAFVQQEPFYTAQNVAVLTALDEEMSLKHKLFYALCIRYNRFRYTAFGREANRTLSSVELPTKVPDWVDSAELPTHDGMMKAASPSALSIQPQSWAEFEIGTLFDVRKGKRLTKASRMPGKIRFIGASEKNNGVTDYNDVTPMFSGGQLTVAYNGNSGWAFYQDEPFFACDDVNVLEPRTAMSKWTLLFIASVLKHGKSRYTYGYKWTKERMSKTKIKLPVRDGVLDTDHMDNFMQSLPFSAVLEAQAH